MRYYCFGAAWLWLCLTACRRVVSSNSASTTNRWDDGVWGLRDYRRMEYGGDAVQETIDQPAISQEPARDQQDTTRHPPGSPASTSQHQPTSANSRPGSKPTSRRQPANGSMRPFVEIGPEWRICCLSCLSPAKLPATRACRANIYPNRWRDSIINSATNQATMPHAHLDQLPRSRLLLDLLLRLLAGIGV